MNQNIVFLINMREEVGRDSYNDPSAFIEFSNGMNDVYKNINKYNSGKNEI